MKNLTVKKIALGLFLAGYAASSAFAIESVSSKAINGNAPVMKAEGKADHTNKVRIYSDGTLIADDAKPKVGDTIEITYNLNDKDGDLDVNDVVKTLKVYVNKTKNATADASKWEAVTVAATADNSGEAGKITFKITDDFAGAYNVGYVILERTQYGLPYYNLWLQVNDIWADNTPTTSKPNANDPLGTLPSDGVGPADHGPGDKANGTGPIIDTTKFKVGIFAAKSDGSPDTSLNYANAAGTDDPAPKYGDKLVAAVWNDSLGSTTNTVDGTGEIASLNRVDYKFTWYLTGTYEGKDADATPLTTGVSSNATADNNDTIVLGATGDVKHNSLYSTDYHAGAQGYNLKVTAQ